MRKLAVVAIALATLAACGGGGKEAASNVAAGSDAATAEAVRDTDAATDAMEAADAELDNLDNRIDSNAAGNAVTNAAD